MKKINIMRFITLSIILVSLTVFQSCSKYSDGPSISLISRKTRLCKDWLLEEQFKNETNVTNDKIVTKLSIDKDGTYSMSSYVNAFGQLQAEYTHGKWTFEDNKGQLYFYQMENGVEPEEDPTHVYTIKELRSKSLKLEERFSSINQTNTYIYSKY